MPESISYAALIEKTKVALRAEWERWAQTLPLEGQYWPRAAVYVRESSVESLVGDAPVVQLRNTLEMFKSQRRYVPWELVTLERATGTELAARTQFRDLLDRAEAGECVAIGAFLSSRFFRNVEEAIVVKRRMARLGVELVWVGKPAIDNGDPVAFLMERNLEIADEWIPRSTSYHVARAFERACEDGVPIGRLPELWRVAERAPGHRADRPGPPIRWELVEPIASLVKEGALRYLAGHTFGDLAKWIASTEIQGKTPSGRLMDHIWWQWNLKNPKLAGFQHRMDHPGYKPGKESAKRAPITSRELLPCLLPPILSLEQHQRILALAKERHHAGVRRRDGYQRELLSGIAFDAGCGHKLHIKTHLPAWDDDFYLRCGERDLTSHSVFFRGRDASRELDELIARMVFDGPLLERIETELRRRDERRIPQRPVSKQELQLRKALDELDPTLFPDIHRQMLARIDAINAAVDPDEGQPKAAVFNVSVDELRRWPEIWASASPEEKNRLLLAAGVRAFVAPIPRAGRKGGFQGMDRGPHSRLVRVEASVPEFALALAAVTGSLGAPSELDPSGQFDATTDSVNGSSQLDVPTGAISGVVRVPDEYRPLLQQLDRWRGGRRHQSFQAA